MNDLRRIPLEGCVNFRDLGGYASSIGGTTKWGVLFRADSMHRLSPADAEVVAGRLGVRTAVDLRADDEREQIGVLDSALGIVEHHIGTSDQNMHSYSRPDPEIRTKSFGQLYGNMISSGGERFAAAIEVVADPENWPAAFFCMAGKDRTGCMAALILGLVGVDRQDIVADYAATAAAVPAIRERSLIELPHLAEVWEQFPDDITTAPTSAMIDLLGIVDDRWDGPEGFALEYGVKPQTIERLREAFLV